MNKTNGSCGPYSCNDGCLNWTRIICGFLAILSMITAVIFYAAPDAGEGATKGLVQATTTVATCLFGTVGLYTHAQLMDNRWKEKSDGFEKLNYIFGLLGFLVVIATPVLFMCNIGPVVDLAIIGGAGMFVLLIPLVMGINNSEVYQSTKDNTEKQSAKNNTDMDRNERNEEWTENDDDVTIDCATSMTNDTNDRLSIASNVTMTDVSSESADSTTSNRPSATSICSTNTMSSCYEANDEILDSTTSNRPSATSICSTNTSCYEANDEILDSTTKSSEKSSATSTNTMSNNDTIGLGAAGTTSPAEYTPIHFPGENGMPLTDSEQDEEVSNATSFIFSGIDGRRRLTNRVQQRLKHLVF